MQDLVENRTDQKVICTTQCSVWAERQAANKDIHERVACTRRTLYVKPAQRMATREKPAHRRALFV